MYTSFSVENFRCFDSLEVGPLERVNLIAGKNNVGKTALLEAMFMHMGRHNPRLPQTVNFIRGFSKCESTAKDMWGWLFHGAQTSSCIRSRAGLTGGFESELTVSVEVLPPHLFSRLVQPNGSADEAGVPLVTALKPDALALRYNTPEDGDKEAWVAIIEGGVGGNKLGFIPAADKPEHNGVFLPSHRRSGGQDDAERFNRLQEIKQDESLLESLKVIEPRLSRLALTLKGGAPVICGDLGFSHLLPLQFAGDGMLHVLSILLAIDEVAGGYVLVDEIENGIHHSMLGKVWEIVAAAAAEKDVQVFATTHSWECICAAHEAFQARDRYDFRLHRLERVDETIQAVTVDEEALDGAIHMGLEVR